MSHQPDLNAPREAATPPYKHFHRSRSASQRQLTVTLILVSAYMIAEFIGGLASNSLALLADAGHMLSDVVALGLSLFAVWVAQRPATTRRTYGYYRAEILAALVNGATLIAVSILIFIEAYRRLRSPPEVHGALMMSVAAGGLVVNLISLWLLHGGKEESLNVQGAWLHVLTDTLGSVATILAAGLIWLFQWWWADPLTSVIVGLLVVFSSWRLIAEAVSILMESAPRGIDVERVRGSLSEIPGVSAVHDLHVWSITSGMVSLSAHVVSTGREPEHLLASVRRMLQDRFGINHVTIQLEAPTPEGRDCGVHCD